MNDTLVTAADLAKTLSISVRQIWRLRDAERLPAPIQIGRLPRWRKSEIESWLAADCPARAEWEAMRKAVTQ